jgi:hypothetical protein
MRTPKHLARRIAFAVVALMAGITLWPATAGASSYEVRLIIQWYPRATSAEGSESIVHGTFMRDESVCASGHNWTEKSGPNGHQAEQRDATYIDIETSGGCFTKFSKVVYDVTLEQLGKTYGPVKFEYTQRGPRVFASSCTDKDPLKTSCLAIPGPLFRAELHEV